jgi:hypothetical protein
MEKKLGRGLEDLFKDITADKSLPQTNTSKLITTEKHPPVEQEEVLKAPAPLAKISQLNHNLAKN